MSPTHILLEETRLANHVFQHLLAVPWVTNLIILLPATTYAIPGLTVDSIATLVAACNGKRPVGEPWSVHRVAEVLLGLHYLIHHPFRGARQPKGRYVLCQQKPLPESSIAWPDGAPVRFANARFPLPLRFSLPSC